MAENLQLTTVDDHKTTTVNIKIVRLPRINFSNSYADEIIQNLLMASIKYILNYNTSIFIPNDIQYSIAVYTMENPIEIPDDKCGTLYNVYKKFNKCKFEMIYVQSGCASLWQKYKIPHKEFPKSRHALGHGVNFGTEFDF
eukprot:384000_1